MSLSQQELLDSHGHLEQSLITERRQRNELEQELKSLEFKLQQEESLKEVSDHLVDIGCIL